MAARADLVACLCRCFDHRPASPLTYPTRWGARSRVALVARWSTNRRAVLLTHEDRPSSTTTPTP